MKILLTAFNAFGEDVTNSSLMALEELSCEKAELKKLVLPTEFVNSFHVLEKAVLSEKFDAVLCLGQAGGRTAITPERVAINLMDASIPDNAGYSPKDEPIRRGAPAAYFSTLPIKEMIARIQGENIPAMISNSAGTFVCNRIMWGLLDLLERENLPTIGGFMHVPFAAEQAKTGYFSLPLNSIIRAVTLALDAITDALKA